MTAANGKVKAEVAEKVVQEVAAPTRMRLDSDELTPKDIKRARVMLNGRNPWDVLDDEDDRFALLIWCFKSRSDPSFTWEQAEETPFSEFDPAVPRNPPPAEPLSSSGSKPERSDGNSLNSEPLNVEPAPS